MTNIQLIFKSALSGLFKTNSFAGLPKKGMFLNGKVKVFYNVEKDSIRFEERHNKKPLIAHRLFKNGKMEQKSLVN